LEPFKSDGSSEKMHNSNKSMLKSSVGRTIELRFDD